jgi:hypothetical protein
MLAISVVIFSCQSDYTKQVKSELAKGIRYDSVLLGINLGDSRDEFYGKCYDLNQKRLVTDGGNGFVMYNFKDSTVHKQTELLKVLFRPNFDKSNILAEMILDFSYSGWSPGASKYQSDSLLIATKKILLLWYGGNDFVIAKLGDREMPVKLDGNRRILLYVNNAQSVQVKVQDILHPIFQHSISKEEGLKK